MRSHPRPKSQPTTSPSTGVLPLDSLPCKYSEQLELAEERTHRARVGGGAHTPTRRRGLGIWRSRQIRRTQQTRRTQSRCVITVALRTKCCKATPALTGRFHADRFHIKQSDLITGPPNAPPRNLAARPRQQIPAFVCLIPRVLLFITLHMPCGRVCLFLRTHIAVVRTGVCVCVRQAGRGNMASSHRVPFETGQEEEEITVPACDTHTRYQTNGIVRRR